QNDDDDPDNLLKRGEIALDRKGKIIFIDRMEELMERYKIFMKRFELSEDFSAQMTVEQLKTQLGQFGMTPQMMFDQMEQTLERMKAEIR
ncbi:MAG: DUF1825 family protein, partial [Microcystis sp.]